MIEGSTDAIESDSHMRYIQASAKFAKEYNNRKASLILKHNQKRK